MANKKIVIEPISLTILAIGIILLALAYFRII